jgi:hypothetical protein
VKEGGARLKIRKWDVWQSYRRDRGQPPWIKVHRSLMRDVNWVSLPDAQRGQLMALWLLAADHNGVIPASPQIIKKLCFMETEPDLKTLIEHGFIEGRRQPDVTPTPQERQHDEPEERRGETEKTLSPDGSVVPATAGPTPEHLFTLWNQKAHPNLPRCEVLSDRRKASARARLLKFPDRSFWDSLMDKVNRSKFLNGDSGKFKCTFDWILNENNLIKILEGNYDGR